MLDKYYTPEIEEFHVGFEYECKKLDEDVWKVSDFTLNSIFGAYLINEGRVRVKHLDREDIEGEGYERTMNNIFTESWYIKKVKKGYWVHLHPSFFGNRTVLRIQTSVNKDSKRTLVVHSLAVKNKSEFRKLFKQLGI